jgi:hypothetical protein
LIADSICQAARGGFICQRVAEKAEHDAKQGKFKGGDKSN